MLEIQYEKFGPPSVVAKCVKAPDPGEPSAWDAIVEIEACSVNPSDLAMLSGRYGKLNKPPAKIGMEASGIVTAIGASVTELKVGDRVMVMANDNWAQRRAVPATLLQKVPKELDPLQVALMKVNPATALLMLREQKPGKNDWVIQNAPLSNVGRAVIQVASCQNVRTINIVRRPEAVQEVKDLGGDVAILDGEKQSTAMVDFVEQRLPGLRNLIDYQELSTPLTIKTFTRHRGGAIYGHECDSNRLLRDQWRIGTSVKNLYLTGTDIGVPGVNSALMAGVMAAGKLLGWFGTVRVMTKVFTR